MSIARVDYRLDNKERKIFLTPIAARIPGERSQSELPDGFFSNADILKVFLMQQQDYLLLKDVAEMFRLQRNAIFKLTQKGYLKTYEVIFYSNRKSNVGKFVYRKDLLECLKTITTKAFERYTTFSNYPEEDLKDYLSRNGTFKTDRVFCVLESELNEKEIEELCREIINGNKKLYTKNDLQLMLKKSESSIIRLMKYLHTLHFNLDPNREIEDPNKEIRESTRIILPTEMDIYALEYIINSLSSSITKRIQLKLKRNSIRVVDFSKAVGAGDFLGLHTFEKCPAPDLFGNVYGDFFFGVSKEVIEREGYSSDYPMTEIARKKLKEVTVLDEQLQNVLIPKPLQKSDS